VFAGEGILKIIRDCRMKLVVGSTLGITYGLGKLVISPWKMIP
jgi:hypothetical protein